MDHEWPEKQLALQSNSQAFFDIAIAVSVGESLKNQGILLNGITYTPSLSEGEMRLIICALSIAAATSPRLREDALPLRAGISTLLQRQKGSPSEKQSEKPKASLLPYLSWRTINDTFYRTSNQPTIRCTACGVPLKPRVGRNDVGQLEHSVRYEIHDRS